MLGWVVDTPFNAVMVIVSAVVIYAALLLLARLAGLRSFSKISGFDFPVTIAFGSVVASVIISRDPPLLQGVAALASLFAIQMLFAWLRLKFGWIEGLSTNTPRVIMIGGKVQDEQMRKAKISINDLRAKLREAGVLNYDQVFAVVAETTGDITVLHGDEEDVDRFDPSLLDNVIGGEAVTDWVESTRGISTRSPEPRT